MVTIFSELETAIPKLLNIINYRIENEKSKIMEMVKVIKWNTGLRSDINKCKVIGVDSSFTLIESRIGIIYVIQGLAVRQLFSSSSMTIEDYDRFYDIGLIYIRSDNPKRIIRRSVYKKTLTAYAYLLELESAYKLLERGSVDLILFDGSLISFLLQRGFKDVNVVIYSVKQATDIDLERILIEKMSMIKGFSKYPNAIFVAKSSNASFYTNGMYPDIYLFELAKLFRIEPYYKAGYCTPIVIEIDKILRAFLGFNSDQNVEFFTITYSRFIDEAPIYQLSFPGKLEEEAIDKLFSYMRMLSPSGYPIPLEYPHRLSKLDRGTLTDIFIKLGIPIISGRELIEISGI